MAQPTSCRAPIAPVATATSSRASAPDELVHSVTASPVVLDALAAVARRRRRDHRPPGEREDPPR